MVGERIARGRRRARRGFRAGFLAGFDDVGLHDAGLDHVELDQGEVQRPVIPGKLEPLGYRFHEGHRDQVPHGKSVPRRGASGAGRAPQTHSAGGDGAD